MAIKYQNSDVKIIKYQNNDVKKVQMYLHNYLIPRTQIVWCKPLITTVQWNSHVAHIKLTRTSTEEPTSSTGVIFDKDKSTLYPTEMVNVYYGDVIDWVATADPQYIISGTSSGTFTVTDNNTFSPEAVLDVGNINLIMNTGVASITLTYVNTSSVSTTITKSEDYTITDAKVGTSYSWTATALPNYTMINSSGLGVITLSNVDIRPTTRANKYVYQTYSSDYPLPTGVYAVGSYKDVNTLINDNDELTYGDKLHWIATAENHGTKQDPNYYYDVSVQYDYWPNHCITIDDSTAIPQGDNGVVYGSRIAGITSTRKTMTLTIQANANTTIDFYYYEVDSSTHEIKSNPTHVQITDTTAHTYTAARGSYYQWNATADTYYGLNGNPAKRRFVDTDTSLSSELPTATRLTCTCTVTKNTGVSSIIAREYDGSSPTGRLLTTSESTTWTFYQGYSYWIFVWRETGFKINNSSYDSNIDVGTSTTMTLAPTATRYVLTYTINSMPTGVASIDCYRKAYNSQTWGTTPFTGSTIYGGDQLYWTATAASGYNDPTVTYPSTSNPYTVDNSNVANTSYVTAGAQQSYTYTINAMPTGIASISCYRKPWNGSSYSLFTGSTIYGGDKLYWTATASAGYNNPVVAYNSSANPYTVAANVSNTTYVSAGSPKSYTYTRGTLPTGVASITCYKYNTSTQTWSTIATNTTIYGGDRLYFTATASTYYNNPTVQYYDASHYLTVTSNVTGANYVTAGSRKTTSISITKNTNIASISITYYNSSGTQVTESVTSSTTKTAQQGRLYSWTATASTGYNANPASGNGTVGTTTITISPTASRKAFIYSRGALPTGVSSLTAYRKPYNGSSYSTISDGSIIYYGDSMYFTPSASTGYMAGSYYPNSSSPLSVTGTVTGASQVEAQKKPTLSITKTTNTQWKVNINNSAGTYDCNYTASYSYTTSSGTYSGTSSGSAISGGSTYFNVTSTHGNFISLTVNFTYSAMAGAMTGTDSISATGAQKINITDFHLDLRVEDDSFIYASFTVDSKYVANGAKVTLHVTGPVETSTGIAYLDDEQFGAYSTSGAKETIIFDCTDWGEAQIIYTADLELYVSSSSSDWTDSDIWTYSYSN